MEVYLAYAELLASACASNLSHADAALIAPERRRRQLSALAGKE